MRNNKYIKIYVTIVCFRFEFFSRIILLESAKAIDIQGRYTGVRSARLSNVSRAKIPFEFRDGGDLLENKALLFVR